MLGSQKLVTVERGVMDELGKSLRPNLNRSLVIVREIDQMNYSCRYLCSPGFDLAATHPPPLQSCFVDSSPSSWPIPVREARHGKDARYYALYSGHRGVPVRHRNLVMEPEVSRVVAYIGRMVVPNRMSYAGQVQDRISFMPNIAHRCSSVFL